MRSSACSPRKSNRSIVLTSHLRDYLGSNQEGTLIWAVAKAFDEAADERRRLAGKRKELNAAKNEITKREAEYDPDAFKKGIEDLIEQHRKRDQSPDSNRNRRGPGAQVPDEQRLVAQLRLPRRGREAASLLSRREKQANDEDSFISTKNTCRGQCGLSEFALGQTFYAEGREVKVNRLDISQEDISYWQFCLIVRTLKNEKSRSLWARLPACSSRNVVRPQHGA